MKISLNWIKQYVDLDPNLTIEQISHDLTMRTVEVEGYINTKSLVEGIKIGELIQLAPHPDADKLTVCQVDLGEDKNLQIVCGGSNLYVGQKLAVAIPGSIVKWHGEGEPVEIKRAELRGIMSEGMICGSSEINLGELFPVREEAEILDLSQFDCNAGDALADVLQIEDYILEIDNKSMTHRPDLWGHYGMAREFAAIYKKELRPLSDAFEVPVTKPYPVLIETDNCQRYMAVVYEGVTVKESPFELRKLLWSVDIRPINSLVDITNFVMLSTGQPTHAFDYEHVESGITVRQAKAEESLTLLDGKVLDLDEEDMLITSDDKAIALAGVMGGKFDSISEATNSMVLEIASFKARSVRRSSQRHNIRTEASTRFEKAIDTARVDEAKALAHKLIMELNPDAQVVMYGNAKKSSTQTQDIRLSLRFLNNRIGMELSAKEVEEVLRPLGFIVLDANDIEMFIQAPVWRSTGDISLADDIVEEVARMIGYENFDFIPPSISLEGFVNQKDHDLERKLKEFMAVRAGFQEIYTYPWIDFHFIEASGLDFSNWIALEAPPSPEERLIRGSLVPSILQAVDQNLANFDSFKIFELAQVFVNTADSSRDLLVPKQEKELVAAIVGDNIKHMFLEAKGIIEYMPSFIDCEVLSFRQVLKPSWADPKLWLNIIDNSGNIIGDLGLLSLKTERLVGIKHQRTILICLESEKLVPLASRENTYQPLPMYPEVWKDLNIVVDENTIWSEVYEVVRPLVKRIEFLEEYKGQQIEAGKKSLIFRYWIASDEKTLSSDEIEAVNSQILHELEKVVYAKLRL